MDNSNSISKLESIYNKMLKDSQSRYENWLVSAASHGSKMSADDVDGLESWDHSKPENDVAFNSQEVIKT